MDVARLNRASFCLLLVGVIVHSVSIALPHFAYADIFDPGTQETERFTMGLFQVCAKLDHRKACVTFGTETLGGVSIDALDWQKACQALAIIGVVFVAGGLGLTGLSIFKESRGDRMRLLPPIICALCGAGAVICLIEIAVFAAKYKTFIDMLYHDDVSGKVDWGFGLDIVACAFFALGGVIHIVVLRMGGQSAGGLA